MKKMFFTLALIAGFVVSKAQFSHSAGASLFYVTSKTGDATVPYGITYFPRYSFGAFSVGVPVTLGLSGSFNSRDGVSEGASFTYHVPLVVDYNFGLGSTEDNESGFGGFIGAGYGLFSTSFVSDYSSGTLKANGPLARAGVRFPISERIFTVAFNFQKGGGEEKANVFGVSLLYNFGGNN